MSRSSLLLLSLFAVTLIVAAVLVTAQGEQSATPDGDDDGDTGANNGPVVDLNDDNFDSIVLDESKDVLVMWGSMKWSAHSVKAWPAVLELAKSGRKDLVVGKVEVGHRHRRHSGEKYHVKGFPTFILFAKRNKSGALVYHGARNMEAFTKFLDKNCG